MSTFYFTVSCPITLRSDRLPVVEIEIDGKLHHIVNTCENAPGASPVCVRCVTAAMHRLKYRERS